MNADFEFVQSRVPLTECLAQLAEEAAELAQAALKVRRVLDGTNPTPTTPQEAWDNLFEEVADTMLCFDLVGIDAGHVGVLLAERNKLKRWRRRLAEAQETTEG